MLAKLKAALDARRDATFVIGARTDAAAVLGKDAAIERACRFVELGADAIKPQTMDTREDIARILREVPAPFLATLSQAAGRHPLDIADFRALGVPAVSLPSTLLFAAVAAVRNTARRVRETGSIRAVQDGLIPLEDYYDLVGLAAMTAREQDYEAAAAALLRGPAKAEPAA
jgi:methylisocitrate lyase